MRIFLLLSLVIHAVLLSWNLHHEKISASIGGQEFTSIELSLEQISPVPKTSVIKSIEPNEFDDIFETPEPPSKCNTQIIKQKIQTDLARHFVYPRRAVERGYQGRVLVEVTVTTLGKVINSTVISSSGHYILDQSAVRDLNKIQLDITPNEEVKLIIPVVYKLTF